MALKIQQFDDVTEYKIKIADGGDFTFDTGDSSGTLTINGNLDVSGTVTQTERNDLVVGDNTITINDGETGAGITPENGTAGIVIDRGTRINAEFFFDERLTSIDSSGGDTTLGAFIFQNADDEAVTIVASGIKTQDNENLYLLGSNTDGYLSVTASDVSNYEKRIFSYTGDNISPDVSATDRLVAPIDPDIIPNIQSVKDYVRDYHTYNFQDKIAALTDSDTFVKVFDADDPAEAISKVEIRVDNGLIGTFKQTNAQFFDVLIDGSTISTTTTNGNLVLEADGTGAIQTSFPVELEKIADPDAPTDGIRLYSKEEADGGTGLFFINENSTNDELISRNKALLYSIIF